MSISSLSIRLLLLTTVSTPYSNSYSNINMLPTSYVDKYEMKVLPLEVYSWFNANADQKMHRGRYAP